MAVGLINKNVLFITSFYNWNGQFYDRTHCYPQKFARCNANMLGRFSRPSVTALFVGCAHHRSWCFQRTRLCTWERRLSYFLTIASCPPYIRGALVYSLVHRGYAAESTRISACIYKSRICWSWSWQTSKICLERGIVEGADRLCFGMRKSMSFNAFDE